MSEYDFEPDYSYWWKKKSFIKEDFIWVLLGIDPKAARKAIEIEKIAEQERSDEDRVYFSRFEYQTCITRRGYRALLRLDWEQGKENFTRAAYEDGHEFPDQFVRFLKSIDKMPHNPDLEKYKEHSRYTANLSEWDLSNIDEDTALPLLLGLNPIYFVQFLELQRRQNEGQKTGIDTPYYTSFSPEEKWLLSQYHDFLKKEFPELIGIDWIAVFLAKRCNLAKKLNLWTGDFSSYVQSLHDNGFVFMPKIYDALKKHEIIPAYSPNGWAIQFFQRFLRQPLWKLKDAASIYRGSDPNGGREFVDFVNINTLHGSGAGFALETSETIAEFDDNDRFVPPPEQTLAEIMKAEENSFDDPTSLEGFVRRHLKAESVVEGKRFEAIEENGELYFKPEMIVKFFRDYLPRTYRPEALYIAMELAKNSANHTAARVASHTSEPYSRFSGDEQLRGDIALYAGGVIYVDDSADSSLGEVLRPATQDKKSKERQKISGQGSPGRKKGSGTIPDDESVKYAKELFDNGKARSLHAAAKLAVDKFGAGPGGGTKESAAKRIAGKAKN